MRSLTMGPSWIVPSVIAILAGMPLAVQPAESVTYSVKYGTVNVGTWTHYAGGHSKTGTYGGTSFNSSGDGTGFPIVTLVRPANADDGKNLFATLRPPNVRLVIQAHRGRVPVSTIACEQSTPDDFGIEGKTETLTFACTLVAVSPTKPGAKSH
jgi:hypothetical protein